MVPTENHLVNSTPMEVDMLILMPHMRTQVLEVAMPETEQATLIQTAVAFRAHRQHLNEQEISLIRL